MKCEIGQNIRRARKQAGITQLQLAKALQHKSAAYIAYIESGQRNIDIISFIKLAKKVKQPVASLLGEKPLKKRFKTYTIKDEWGIQVAEFTA